MDLTKLSDAELMALAQQVLGAGANKPADPLALDQSQLHAATGSVLEGVPVVGPAMRSGAQRIGAAIDVATGTPGLTQSPEDALKRREGVFNKAVEQNPVTAGVGHMIGGVAGTAPLMAAAPAAFGIGAGPVVGRAVASSATNAALGGADAAVRSGGDPTQAAWGAGIGGGLGMLAMPGAAVAGKTAAAGADALLGLSSPTGAISGITKPAARYAADMVGDPARMAAWQRELARLGPEAMLADVSPGWLGVARGAASLPQLRDDIVNPLVARNAAKNGPQGRLAQDLNALGPARDPEQITAGIAQEQKALQPEYDRVLENARAVDTSALADRLDTLAVNTRGDARKAILKVREWLDVPGSPGTLDPHPRAMLAARQAIDGILVKETDSNVIRILEGTRRHLDDRLASAAPGIKDVDAYYQELARQREALQLGGKLFDTGKEAPRPAALAKTFAQSGLPEGTLVGPSASPLRTQQGARAEIDRLVGQKANDPLALQTALKGEGDWNRDKLRTVFGPERANQALNAVDREMQFAKTGFRVTEGSDTAMAAQFGNFLKETATPGKAPLDTTLTGLGLRGVEAGVKKILGSNAEAKAQQFADQLGRLAIAQGGERDLLMRSLLDLVNTRASLTPIENAASRAMRALIVSAASNRGAQTRPAEANR